MKQTKLVLLLLLLHAVALQAQTLNLKLFLQGYLIGTGSTMRATLYNLPDGMHNIRYSNDPTACDTIKVNLWLPVHLSNSIADFSTKVILHTNGTATATFPANVIGNSYYIAIRHRNTLETWSNSPVLFATQTVYNFTSILSQAYSNGFNPPMKFMNPEYAFWSGDVNQDGAIDCTDMMLVDNDANHFASGYINTDCNGDGVTNASDMSIVSNNSGFFISFARP